MRARHGRAHGVASSCCPRCSSSRCSSIALLDPDLKIHEGSTTPARVLILQDISSSMDLQDDGRRGDRADKLIRDLEAGAPSSVRFELLPFDTVLHEAGYVPKPGVERGTDLAAVLESLGTNPKLADADGAIVVTDGGDETVPLAQVADHAAGHHRRRLVAG